MPAPEENAGALYEHLLRRNLKLYGAAFAIGEEDAVFLTGETANEAITDDELDRILGSLYMWVEQFLRPAMRIGLRSEEHTSELQSLMRISYAVFRLQKKISWNT